MRWAAGLAPPAATRVSLNALGSGSGSRRRMQGLGGAAGLNAADSTLSVGAYTQKDPSPSSAV